jgi:hypothetical protein
MKKQATMIDGYAHLGAAEAWDSETADKVLSELRRPTFTVEQSEYNRASVRAVLRALIQEPDRRTA